MCVGDRIGAYFLLYIFFVHAAVVQTPFFLSTFSADDVTIYLFTFSDSKVCVQ